MKDKSRHTNSLPDVVAVVVVCGRLCLTPGSGCYAGSSSDIIISKKCGFVCLYKGGLGTLSVVPTVERFAKYVQFQSV